MSDYNAWDDQSDEVSARRRRVMPVAALWLLAGGMLSCLLLFGLLRLPLTGRWLRPIFVGPEPTVGYVSEPQPVPALTPSVTMTSVIQSGSQGAIATPVVATPGPSRSPEPRSQPIASAASLADQADLLPPNADDLRRVMVDAINRDRAAVGLGAVANDETATRAGQSHAEDMLVNGYFSHWNLQGYGPEHRYTLAGGNDAAFENNYMFWYRYDNGAAAPIQDWPQLILDAEASLMDSLGHRANILTPHHTHVGIGIAYDPVKGELRLAQEFVNRWIEVSPLPQQASPGDTVQVSGRLLPGASQPLINVAHQPMPQPYTIETVPQGTYTSAAETFAAVAPQMSGDRFVAEASLDRQRLPGLYQVRVWVQVGDEQVLASARTIWVP